MTRIPGSDQLYLKDLGNELDEYGLCDELDILQEENEVLLEKPAISGVESENRSPNLQLQEAEQKCKEAEARAKFLEREVASLGEGAFPETTSLRRKQEELRRREEALRTARQNRVGKEEIANLRSAMKSLRKEAAEGMSKLQEADSEANTLRIMTQRMILTHEEMAFVQTWQDRSEDDSNGSNKSCQDPGDLPGEGNIEAMLSVEMGLKEMASLKIEDAVMLSMVQRSRPNLVQGSLHSFPFDNNYNMAGDPMFVDSFELSQEESNDVRFKEAWLTYFWKRARDHQVGEDMAEERLRLWTSRIGESPTVQDAVDAERGLIELRKLGMQQQLWEACRKEVVYASLIEAENEKYAAESENSQ
ncbi:hypothetical protein Cgig2_015588 [Carnegiea gigantea]|uniref:Uncharacterized protein n=1 Tax=Carnegiea gigantea TaxID=171969 RepID=A0A9Q1Q9D3_9CARY|nr:hypothetical protein Cgig2_015588 [Carnegiea gigantea]